MAEVTFRVAPENAWVLEIPDAERDFRLNALLHLAHRSATAVATAAPEMGADARAAFQRVYDMLHVAIPRALQVAHNSSSKGAAAELSMDEHLAAHFPTLTLRDASAHAHAGDRHLVGDGFTIMVEFKDYANPVPTKEVAKFERDVAEAGFQVAVMCSFETHICRKAPGRITFEQIGSSVLVYMPTAGRDASRLLAVLAWAEWFCRHEQSHARHQLADRELAVRAATQAIDLADTVQRELQSAAERMRKELDRVDAARLAHLTELKTRLRAIA